VNPHADENDRRLVVEIAARWFVQLERKDAQQRGRFVRWLNQSPEHVKTFLEVAAIEAMLEGLPPQPPSNRWPNTVIGPMQIAGAGGGRESQPQRKASSLECALHRALENEEFVLHYQPKVELETRRLTGVEALIRWQCPERGLVEPAEFISILEDSGMIVDVGEWVLRQALIDRSRWLEMGLDAPRVAVNISPVQLNHKDFVANFKSIQNLPGKDAGLDIEVTETALANDVESIAEKLTAVRALGFRIVLDEFGTGYSALAHLKRLPLDALKIDRTFLRNLPADNATVNLVTSIIALARCFELEVVAVGVESEVQAKCLARLGCEQIQGSVISMPKAFDEITSYFKGDRADANFAVLTAQRSYCTS
jgi:EAL domain-containing protein (putative c-di-GMP-specific phosphodiesterase class I)